MTFDVASVRENKSAEANGSMIVSGQFLPNTTVLQLVNWRIEDLMGLAYEVDEHQIVGDPKWPSPTVFVIQAKGDSNAEAKLAALTKAQQGAEQQHMLAVLLEERFKLKFHWEMKAGDIYNLVVAKGGAKLRAAGSMQPSSDEVETWGNLPVPAISQKNDGRGFDDIAHKCSMGQWAGWLTSDFGRPVIDKTGLTGYYDFVLRYKGRWDRDREADDLDPTPPLDRALQEELGLRVEPAKGQVRILVIDHIEKPSEN